jgi:hypothetical protein
MNYWMFILTSQKEAGLNYSPEDILRQRVADRFWGLGEKTPNRRALQRGDMVVFYLANPHKAFAASAVLGSASFALSPAEQEELAHGTALFRAPYGVRLEQPIIWEQAHKVEDLLAGLSFIENKAFWYAYFQGGVRQLDERDFQTIISQTVVPSATAIAAGLPRAALSEAEFSLEAHLEEFIDKNWNGINFNRKLRRYTTDAQNGRQFPAGLWSIDFLCIDEDTGNLVVVELKKGKTSDATVGQVLRYISWVEEHVAEKGQAVEGIIIAREIDEALYYAVKNLSHINVLTYKVDFTLQKPSRAGRIEL